MRNRGGTGWIFLLRSSIRGLFSHLFNSMVARPFCSLIVLAASVAFD
jgi:hypothetical protein